MSKNKSSTKELLFVIIVLGIAILAFWLYASALGTIDNVLNQIPYWIGIPIIILIIVIVSRKK